MANLFLQLWDLVIKAVLVEVQVLRLGHLVLLYLRGERVNLVRQLLHNPLFRFFSLFPEFVELGQTLLLRFQNFAVEFLVEFIKDDSLVFKVLHQNAHLLDEELEFLLFLALDIIDFLLNLVENLIGDAPLALLVRIRRFGDVLELREHLIDSVRKWLVGCHLDENSVLSARFCRWPCLAFSL